MQNMQKIAVPVVPTDVRGALPGTTKPLVPEEQGSGYIADKLVKAEKRIQAYPYDTEAWSILIRDAQIRKIEDARVIYERLVEQFPNAGKYWKIYIEHELKLKNFERVEKLFQRCLIKVLNIELWKLYLNYIKETKGSLPSYREKMAQAYDFALEKIGMDIMSYQIWAEYISFLKSVEAIGSYAENQRITAVRKVYQRGVTNPMINIELLWKDYTAYENSINNLIAKKMIDDRSREYMSARRVAKEYEVATRGLDKNAPSVPPQNTYNEIKQVELWKKYIAWEKKNPLRTEDQTIITKRVMFAYEQCLLCIGHHPDIWIEAASYLDQSSKILIEKGDQNAGKVFADEAAAIYERAINSLMKKNMLIYFAYADFEESRMKFEKVHQIYKKFLDVEEVKPTLAYIQYMKFARRAEGIKSARLVFKAAREDKRSDYHVYVAAALMEYYCSKEKSIALKIFELGLKRFGDNPEYASCYIDFMSHLNEDNNTRVLFERVLSSDQLQPEKSTDIWSKFLLFESQVGDLASIVKVEKRRASTIEKIQAFNEKETALLIDRYKFLGLLPCADNELRAIGYWDLVKHHVLQLPTGTAKQVLLSTDDDDEKAKRPKYPQPDIDQMLPFKPRAVVPTAAHPVPGGVFPPPPAASLLLQSLPPPECFHGPHVIIDKFMELMRHIKLPDKPVGEENGKDGDYRLDPGTRLSLEIASGARKRKITENESDEEDTEISLSAPVNDIYRARQQKKVIK
ncbi:cleavage stimulation factor subunit 3-like [Biomphalaria glabrata]|uniref:Cleavage stimulation factor subunit 3-like n=3 Tax=Biomphalaria glabrata TaxID=6526 RepID=A0A9W3AJS5_BIOGL|nr:cleavage stimulation factor subunit 3-like [Biomphalaria glabrata]XP_055887389.1 cleavage stimulation factor subunit 3-like [Biomphalaria glabrata]KAI8772672.1 cleavage stimulation factor subunit 3 [Biomphalaria glabrata]